MSHIFPSSCNSNMSTHWNISNNVQKAEDLTNPAKKRNKMSIIDINFQIQIITLACGPSKSPLQSLIFFEM